MRIVSWNCNGGFRKKLPAVRDTRADLLVIQEASARDVAGLDAHFTHWVGRPNGRGLAIIDHAGLDCRIHPSYRPDLPWFIPLETPTLRILAVWACLATPQLRYVRLVHAAMDHFEPFLAEGPAIAIGDFNSNTVFDRKHQSRTHTALVERFARLGMASQYHVQSGEGQGEESIPTFYLYRHLDRPFHLDFAFASNSLRPVASMVIGSCDQWLQLSDHLPLILDLDMNESLAGERV